jgi:hypothetical protein
VVFVSLRSLDLSKDLKDAQRRPYHFLDECVSYNDNSMDKEIDIRPQCQEERMTTEEIA